MGAGREARESEKTLSYIWSVMPHLQVTVWYPLEEDAIECAVDIITHLGKLVGQLKEQRREKEQVNVKQSFNKMMGDPIEQLKKLEVEHAPSK